MTHINVAITKHTVEVFIILNLRIISRFTCFIHLFKLNFIWQTAEVGENDVTPSEHTM